MNKKWFAASAVLMTVALSAGHTVQAAPDLSKKSTSPQIVDVYEAPEAPGHTVRFYDETLANRSSVTGIESTCSQDPITDPNIRSTTCYHSSSYTPVTNRVIQYDYTGITDHYFLISVAKGSTKSMTSSVTRSSTVEVSATVSLTTPLVDAINVSLTSSYSGTVSRTYSTTTVYSGPPESSPYNSRNYYAGVVYDLYEVTVNRTDYYTRYTDQYSNGVLINSYSTDFTQQGTEYHQAQKPKHITYSVDTNY